MKQIKPFFRRWESGAGIIISKLHQVYVRFIGSTWSIHIIWREWKNIYILHTRFTSSNQFTIKLGASSCGFIYWACVYHNTLCNCLSISFFSFFFSSVFLDRLAKVNFKCFSNSCFKHFWPGSELFIWYDVCFQAMFCRDKQ